MPIWVDMFLMEGAERLHHEATARQFLRRYKDMKIVTSGVLFMGPLSIARVQGNAAYMVGEYALAREYYEKAIEEMQTMRIRPELALSHLGLAELLLEHYPDERDAAIEELTEMKMQPALERALRHKGLLKA